VRGALCRKEKAPCTLAPRDGGGARGGPGAPGGGRALFLALAAASSQVGPLRSEWVHLATGVGDSDEKFQSVWGRQGGNSTQTLQRGQLERACDGAVLKEHHSTKRVRRHAESQRARSGEEHYLSQQGEREEPQDVGSWRSV
jgi:hypothetical protein